MKAANLYQFCAAILLTGLMAAQSPEEPMIEPVAAPLPEAPVGELGVPTETQNVATELPPPPLPDAPAAPPAPATPSTAAPFAPLEQQKQEMQKSEEGYIIKDANLNDIFQFLAKSAGRQYFHNAKIAGTDYLVTGHLNDGNPLQQMEELAFMYGLSLHTKGNTIYALTQAQLSQLPNIEWHYQLQYLRPLDIDQIKELIKPMLSPGTGIVNFEPKTNTIIIIDSAHRIEEARSLLHGIDKAKGQIIVETKILRVNSNAAERTGVNWSNSLGKTGTSLSVASDLNSVFGLPNNIETDVPSSGSGLVLSPVQLNGVLHALSEGGLARQISNPTLITEDNEKATISIIDRIPIITTTSTANTSGGNPTITEEVRYQIDTKDKTIDESPESHREIGISMVVTPTLLPDGTVRMSLRPRSAQIVEQIKSITGNVYPRVEESMVTSIARVPNGHSLIVGGFYGETQSQSKNKIPLLGDVPILNFFFKSKELTKEKTSLVFIVTPRSYDPTNRAANRGAGDQIRAGTTLDCDHDWIDEDNPGPAYEPNIKRTLRGLKPSQAPYYPKPEELEEGEEVKVVRQPVASYAKEETAPSIPLRATAPKFSKAGKH